jgi:restriction system protein
MATKYRWQKVVTNSYLGKTRVVQGMTKAEVNQIAAQLFAQWAAEEARKRQGYQRQLDKQAQQNHLQALEAQAQAQTRDAQQCLDRLNGLLRSNLASGKRFRWDDFKQTRPYPQFTFTEWTPTYEQAARALNVPAPSILEGLMSGKRLRREQLEVQARQHYAELVARHEAQKAAAFDTFEKQRMAYEHGRDEFNASIDDRRSRFEQGDRDAVEWVLREVLDNLGLPEDYGKDIDVAFDQGSGTAIVNMQLPTVDELPRVAGYRFVKARKAVEPVDLKPKEFEALYDSVQYQICLLTIHRVFRELLSPPLQAVVFNGWITGIDPKTGRDFTSCIISVRADQQAFQAMNLERVDPKECIRNLKGLVAGPLSQIAPVRPILDLDRSDSRFIESREVLEGLSSDDNLAMMDWEEFEHLVRELFSKVFGGDSAAVRITQASRDHGVDAIAFDPDPIRGGKFVIQAKRYNNVVPVSAVRDLYGTMINEGAVKGILVTTSYYGSDSLEFAKDKPLTLINGSNLVQMFQDYGYQVRIELQR